MNKKNNIIADVKKDFDNFWEETRTEQLMSSVHLSEATQSAIKKSCELFHKKGGEFMIDRIAKEVELGVIEESEEHRDEILEENHSNN